MWAVLKKLISDCMTSANGDYDPARVIGYGFVALASIQFLVSTAYVTIISGTFDANNFALGVAGISGTIVAAGAGVWLKKDTEVPLDATTTTSVASGASGVDVTRTTETSTAK